jgi:hypothetical protein
MSSLPENNMMKQTDNYPYSVKLQYPYQNANINYNQNSSQIYVNQSQYPMHSIQTQLKSNFIDPRINMNPYSIYNDPSIIMRNNKILPSQNINSALFVNSSINQFIPEKIQLKAE